MNDSIRPFEVLVSDDAIADLHRRLDATRWPDAELVQDWSQGVPLAALQDLVSYWRTQHDWRKCEAWMNAAGSFMTEIDGVDIHFLHIRSPHAEARPLLLTHGWPGAILEFRAAIPALVDPVAHGGSASDAFHLVIPSLPGYGFSGKPTVTGWGVNRIAAAWEVLMERLGYGDHWLAQGGDWGAAVTTRLGVRRHKGLASIHVNMPIVMPTEPTPPFSPEEQAMLDAMGYYAAQEAGYSTEQATRPQTLGYSLADSAAGQAAWIYEKFSAWSDCSGSPESAISRDEMLDIISLYWFSNSGTSSGRLYWESFAGGFFAQQLELPVGCSVFAHEIYRAPRSWAEKCMKQIVHWNELPQGGHFAALEQPSLYVEEVRSWARQIR
ncbi:MAG: epoxide hydrolase family protein [Pseudomonadota bacterium]